MQSRYRRSRRRDSSNHALAPTDGSVRDGKDGKLTSTRRRKGSIKSLHVLAAILLKNIGEKGVLNLFSLAVVAVSLPFIYF